MTGRSIRSAHLHRHDFGPDGSLGPCLECEQEDSEIVLRAVARGRPRSSGVVYALCPFHDEKTPSLAYYPRTGRFVCRGCRVQGFAEPPDRQVESPDQLEMDLLVTALLGIQSGPR